MDEKSEKQLFEDVGGLKANMETYHNDTKKALDLITGNGKPEDGILYIMTDIRKGIKGLQDWTDKHVCETHKLQDEKIAALEQQQATAKEQEDKAAGAADATKGAVIIKYAGIKDFIAKAIPFLKHPAMIFMYFLMGGGGLTAWNWHNISGSLKGLLKFIVQLAVEAYKNGGN